LASSCIEIDEACRWRLSGKDLTSQTVITRSHVASIHTREIGARMMHQRNKIERSTADGEFRVHGVRAMGSTTWTFTAYARVEKNFFAPDAEGGSRFIAEGTTWERMGSHPRVLESLDAPANMVAKRARLKAQDYQCAYDVITREFPQTVGGIRLEGKIEVDLIEDPE
jgi:hypothetical protein